MNSEKVKEIKKALECCKKNEIEETCVYCPVCPASNWDYEKECMIELFQKTLTLINELESENERLMKLQSRGGCRVAELGIENQQLKDRIAELEDEIERLETVIDKEYKKWTEVKDAYQIGQLNELKKV